tara:strand:+ start:744474 stop:744920 length:447 start_codon:yes stop_codon:yes gene_type:complete
MNEITMNYLKQLNSDIKSGNFSKKDEALNLLTVLDAETLHPGLQMYRSYLLAKIYYLNSKHGDVLENMLAANNYYKEIFFIARHNDLKVNDSRYHFKHAESFYRLYLHSLCYIRREELLKESFRLTHTALLKYPKNSSLNWLMDEITK